MNAILQLRCSVSGPQPADIFGGIKWIVACCCT